jgi:DNA-binding FrmR family transcriptional regulator
MASYEEDKQDLLVRLRRIEGQLKGIQRMLEEDRYCVDVLNQLSSVIAATHKVATLILKDHIRGCVRNALSSGEDGDQHVSELLTVIENFTGRK